MKTTHLKSKFDLNPIRNFINVREILVDNCGIFLAKVWLKIVFERVVSVATFQNSKGICICNHVTQYKKIRRCFVALGRDICIFVIKNVIHGIASNLEIQKKNGPLSAIIEMTKET
jgi:hypothetical protein